MKKCQHCGYPNPDERTACFQCGDELTIPVATPPPPPVPPQVAPAKAIPGPAERPAGALYILLALLIAGALMVGVIAYEDNKASEAAREAADINKGNVRDWSWITYKVTGSTSSANVTYSASGSTCQESGVSIPWSHRFRADNGEFLYISAQNQADYGTVRVAIEVDGAEAKSSTSSGAYVIASTNAKL